MNLSICDANALMGYSDCEEAQAAYLKARERPELQPDPMGYKAELFADEVRQLVQFLRPVLTMHSRRFFSGSEDNVEDLLQFFLKRHWHYRFPKAKH